jgi:hypothetical protein
MTISSEMKVEVERFSKAQAIPPALLLWVLTIVCLGAQSEWALGQTSGEQARVIRAAQIAERRASEIRIELQRRWDAFSTTRDALTDPAERIRRTEEWISSQQASFDELKASEAEARRIRKPVKATQQFPTPIPSVGLDRLQSDIVATDAEISKEVRKINQQATDPLDRIQWMEEFLALNRKAFVQRDQNHLELMKRLQAQRSTLSNSVPLSQAEARRRQLFMQVRDILAESASLPPVERIKAIESKRQELLRLDGEIKSIEPSR